MTVLATQFNGESAHPLANPTEATGLTPRRLLIVEDNPLERRHLQQLLQSDPELLVDTVDTGSKALDYLRHRNCSVVVTDLRMPGLDGMDLLKEIQDRGMPVTVIVTTGHSSIEEAVEAIRMGAYDFLTKPFEIEQLRLVVQRALRERSLQDELVSLREQLRDRFSFHNILSKNPRMHAIFELIKNVADTPTTVLIEGETGTGKEQVARAIHQASANHNGPFVAVNCAALPESLLDSELFGHEKGAFTSAVGQRRGRFELADGGTLFLDEIGDIPATMQAKLLRVLQERCFERVGGTQSIEVNVRIIAATNRPLQNLVRKGTFREDLYYRLNVLKIELPPLRERMEDIPLLAAHFARKYCPEEIRPKEVSPSAMEVLLNHHWPGNVRELENAIERGCVTSLTETIGVENLPPELTRPPLSEDPFHVSLERPLPDVLREITHRIEEQYIRKALQRSHGDVGRCARICGVARRTITAKISEYNIDKATYKEI